MLSIEPRKFSQTEQVQFAAVSPPRCMSSNTCCPHFSTINPSKKIASLCNWVGSIIARLSYQIGFQFDDLIHLMRRPPTFFWIAAPTSTRGRDDEEAGILVRHDTTSGGKNRFYPVSRWSHHRPCCFRTVFQVEYRQDRGFDDGYEIPRSRADREGLQSTRLKMKITGEAESAMTAYAREGEGIAYELENRGPIKFNGDGTIDRDVLTWTKAPTGLISWRSFSEVLRPTGFGCSPDRTSRASLTSKR